MQTISTVEGTCLPLKRSDVDTDQIIPSDWLKRVERTGFEKGLFSEWRDDPSFELNNELYANAKILVAGPNFGTGSSREHAVWAIQQYGFQAVISTKFGDIFKNNSTKCGLVPVEASDKFVDALFEAIAADPNTQVQINISDLTVEFFEAKENFHLDPTTQEKFLQGLDDIDLTLKKLEEIEVFEKARPVWL